MKRLHRPPTDAELWRALRRGAECINEAMQISEPAWGLRIDEERDMVIVTCTGMLELVALPPGASLPDMLMFVRGAGFGLLVAAPPEKLEAVAAALDPILKGSLLL